MNEQGWLDLWHHFLQVMSSEPIETRIAIGIVFAFFAIMSLTGIADSFLPRRAARRYAAMYDLMPAVGAEPAPQQNFTVVPPSPPPAEEPLPEPEEPEEIESSGDLRYGESGVNFSAMRRSTPPPPKVLRAQKP